MGLVGEPARPAAGPRVVAHASLYLGHQVPFGPGGGQVLHLRGWIGISPLELSPSG